MHVCFVRDAKFFAVELNEVARGLKVDTGNAIRKEVFMFSGWRGVRDKVARRMIQTTQSLQLIKGVKSGELFSSFGYDVIATALYSMIVELVR